MAKIKFKVEGMKDLEKSLKKLGKVPQKHVTPSAKKGMTIALKDAKSNAPYETGALEKGTILVGEKSKFKAKKVYRVVWDSSMNDIFQKFSVGNDQFRVYHGYNRTKADPRWEKKQYYYPVSVEYGFFARNGRYIPGHRYVHDSLTNNVSQIEKTIVTTMKKKIDVEIAKVGLK